MQKNIIARLILLISVCITLNKLSAQNPVSEKPLTNKDIISMVGSGLSAGVIKAAIEKSSTNFDCSPAAIIQLKKSGIPDDLTLAMISKRYRTAATAPRIL